MSCGPADDDNTRERRGADRRRVLKAGIIAFNNRHSTLQCSVRDLSETGARLTVVGTISAPDTFELIVELDGLEASCEVVTRRGNDVRVHFVSAPRAVAPRRIQVVAAPDKPVSLRRKARSGEA